MPPPLVAQPKRRGRPPRNADAMRPETRDSLIRAGVVALTQKGYSSIGIEEVLRAVQVPKGSFYHWFESKEAFGRELIAAYAEYFAAKLDRWLLDAGTPPLRRLRNFVQDASDGMARHDYARGCLVGNLGQEMGALPESFRTRLEAVFLDWQARTAACLAEAQRSGEISPSADCQALAHFFWIGWEGAVLRAKLTRSAEPLQVFADGFFALLRAGR